MTNKILYRKNVSLITLSGSWFLLVNLKSWPKNYWKFPQGGVNKKELLIDAANREFKEELGTDNLKIISKSKIKRKYKWDKPMIINGKEYVGQDQSFLIVHFLGARGDLKINKDEIRSYKWVKISDLKKFIYRKHLDLIDYWNTIEKIMYEQKWQLKKKDY